MSIKLRIDNITDIHQYDLLTRLYASRHVKFADKLTEDLIIQEIYRRKNIGIWLHSLESDDLLYVPYPETPE